MLDDGRLTDAKGRTVNFKNSIIVMTSNIPENEIKQNLQPEFINRIDEILTFNDLGIDEITTIVELQLVMAVKMLANLDVELQVDPSVKEFLQKNGYQPEYGARPIKRLIKQHILAPVSKHRLAHPSDSISQVEVENDKICIKSKKA